MLKLSDQLRSKLELLRLKSRTRFYSFVRIKFRKYLENKDIAIVSSYCKEITPLLNEINHFYTKIHPINISVYERTSKNILDDVSLTYGETSWKGMIEIIKYLEIKKKDIFYDLGCGSGKFVFLINLKFGIRSIGIDQIESFIKISNIVTKKLQLENICFFNDDFLTENIYDGSIFYITATCFDEELMSKIIKKMKKIKTGAKVVVITQPLDCEHLELYKTMKCNFSWARDNVYFYKKI